MRRFKWSIQYQTKADNAAQWKDCHVGHPTVLGYTEFQEENLLRDFQRITEAFPDNTYRIVQHVDFTPAVAAAIKAR